MSDIQQIEFSIFNSEDIRKHSVLNVTSHELFDKGVPKADGLCDLRLGTINREYICQTCKQNAIECSGHFGHIELEEPVYNILFTKYITKILQSVCLKCSGLLNKEIKQLKTRKDSFKNTVDNCKNKNKCLTCDFVRQKIVFDNFKYYIQTDDGNELLSMANIHSIFQKICKEDYNKLGFSSNTKPTDFIISAFPVPPPQVRPSIIIDSSIKSQDDLTYKLVEIIKTNNSLMKAKQTETNEGVISELKSLLQYHVSTFIDNGISGIPQSTQRTGRPIKGISQRLKAKEGRIRGNLMGKRVDFSGRTVITAEPNIDLNELGIPHKIAQTLTYPEIANRFNIEKLQEYVNNGPVTSCGVTGAKYVFTKDGKQKDLRFVSKDAPLEIEIGDKVERHLKDGDLVVFNRQPSLHKYSMMGHKVRVMPFDTFRMNLSATNPYNADFDGDEMNIHVPQSEQTKAEIQEVMMIEKNIISSQSNKPVIGIIQDSLLGTFKITSRDTFIRKELFMNIMMKLKVSNYNLPKPTIHKPKELWTGKQVFDLILPSINLRRFTPQHTSEDIPSFSVNDSEVYIKNGKLITGQLCKKSIGATEGGIIHITWLDCGSMAANDFISQTQYLINCWLQETGFSIGAGDIFANERSNEAVDEIVRNAKEKVNQIITIGKRNNLKRSVYEPKINQVLNNAVAQSGRQVELNTTLDNNIKTTVTSGSKGSILNIAQIMGCVGQQNVAGKRVALGYTDRVLPHFEQNDIGPAAKGFVENSYKKGLTPYEFYYHAMCGREGVIDTAVKTSETGYIQRRLVKAMEDLQVFHDKTLRNSIGDVVQFVYGQDGMDATYLISENFKLWNSDKEFSEMFVERSTPKDEISNLREIKENIKCTTLKSPVHIHRLLDTILIKYKKKCATLSPKFIYENLCSTLKELTIYYHKKQNDLLDKFNYNAVYVLHSMLRIIISSKQVRKVHQLSKEAFVDLLECIKFEFQRSLVSTGEMVGTTSAQSLGEVTTQLTLNTFHNAGNSSKNATLGVPRLKEIINVSKNIKTPMMNLRLKDEYNTKESAEKIAAELEFTNLKSLVKSYKVIQNTNSDYSDLYLSMPAEYEDEYCDLIIQYSFDRDILQKKKLSLLDISVVLLKQYQDIIYVTHNNENCEELLMDIHIIKTEEMILINIERYIRVLCHKLQHECVIQGSSEIKQTYISEENNNFVIETDGSCIDFMMNNKYFDYTKIKTNDINNVLEVLGVEAARTLLLAELRKVIEFDGTYVNMRHFLTLVDTMTYKGDIMAITRHGINKSNTGPLMKCSFEETVDVLTEAAIFSETDSLKGVTENIIVGKMSKVGTGNMDLLMDL